MRHPRFAIRLLSAVAVVLSTACANSSSPPTWHEQDGHRWAELSPGSRGRTGFRRLSSSRTGVDFENRLATTEMEKNRYYLNGSGVATGDVDGDGRPDVFFARLDGPNVLYHNLGGLRFEDVTDSAGVALPDQYSTSAVLADVDGDGDLDLLVGSIHRGVTLLLNDGKGHFTRSADSGLEDTAHKGNMTLTLADVDGDGDLDLYVTEYREHAVTDVFDVRRLGMQNILEGSGRKGDPYRLRPPFDRYYVLVYGPSGRPERAEVGEPDQLFLNDGKGHFREADPKTHFLDVDGRPSGLPRDWGLTARFEDLNGDGLPDLYVCNDFWTRDRVWINQGGGIFRALDPRAVRNFPFSSMSVAEGDVNGDGHMDFFVTEMRSAQHERQGHEYVPWEPPPDHRLDPNGQPQYNRNALYVNRGDGTWVETAYYSGVAASEWTWATRFMDVDLDGREDILVNTGMPYDLQDLDTQLRMNVDIARGMRSTLGLTTYPPYLTPNEAFRNNGDLTFTRVSKQWGFKDADVSQGIAVADFDGDGDLDLVENRLNAPAAVYENTGTAPRIAVRLLGRAPNTAAVGARVRLEGAPVTQTLDVVAGGDYLSGSDGLLMFAAPKDTSYSLRITWPDGGRSAIEGVRANRIYEVRQPAAAREEHAVERTPAPEDASPPMFQDISDRLRHRHRESQFNDFGVQPLLPFMLSREGPPVAWLDLDGDGDEDLLVGAARGGHPAAFENLGGGRFRPMALGTFTDTVPADQTALVGWHDRQGAVIVAGSSNFELGDTTAPSGYVWRVGQHGSVEGPQPLQGALSTTGPVAAADVDGDGDVDLFVGGHFLPAYYPTSASSRIFLNKDGRFVYDATASAPFTGLGLVTGAVFSDVDGDGDPDLILSTAWGSLMLFRNDGGTFTDVTSEWGLDRWHGWWNGVATGDFNGDGRPDIVATNLGLNSPYQVDPGHPLRLYYADFNWDGRMDLIDAFWDPETKGYVPRLELTDFVSIPSTILQNVKNNRQFAAATVSQLLGDRASGTLHREIDHLQSMVFLNRGGSFEAEPLPREAQLTAASAPVVADMDGDGREDVFLSQNFFDVRPRFPRLDGGRGLWLRGDGTGGFQAIPGQVSGVKAYGDQRGAAVADLDGDGRVDLVVGQNNDTTRLYWNHSARAGLVVRLVGPPDNRDGIGAAMRVVYADGGKGPLREVQAGSGYRSMNAAVQVLGTAPGRTVRGVEVRWPGGAVQTVPVEAGQSTLTIRREQ